MATHRSREGLDLPIIGAPEPSIDPYRAPKFVALVGADYPGLRPTMFVAEGQAVRRGELVFEDKKTPGARFTAPGAGRVAGIHRGERRLFRSLVIELEDGDGDGDGETVAFESFTGKHPEALDSDKVAELLLESGEWTALRARPFGRVADPATRPHSIFVTAIDTNPLAAPVDLLVKGSEREFELGLAALKKLTEGPVYVCTAESSSVPVPARAPYRHERFAGPHPAGTVGYHIHVLDPVSRSKTVWYTGPQDVVAMGRLFDTGKLDLERVVSLAGPMVSRPRLVRTRRGASTDEMVAGELGSGEPRVVSGSILSGRRAMGPEEGYLGRYHQQVSVVREDRERVFLGWLDAGLDKFSAKPVFLSRLFPGKKFDLTTSTHGSPRAIVPIGSYEKVMPMDILPTFLLRALVMKDVERARELGCLELEEEDLALCTFVDVGKTDFGIHLRDVLDILEEEG